MGSSCHLWINLGIDDLRQGLGSGARTIVLVEFSAYRIRSIQNISNPEPWYLYSSSQSNLLWWEFQVPQKNIMFFFCSLNKHCISRS